MTSSLYCLSFAFTFRIFEDGANDFTLIVVQGKQIIIHFREHKAPIISIISNRTFDYRLSCFSIVPSKQDRELNNITLIYVFALWMFRCSASISHWTFSRKNKEPHVKPYEFLRAFNQHP